MKVTLRTRLKLIIGSATAALLGMVAVSLIFAVSQLSYLTNIERKLVPKLEFAPKLERELDHMKQRFQDAVAAEDKKTLDEALATRNRLLELVSRTGDVLDPAVAAQLRWAIQDYYETGRAISERLIAGETGERLVEDMQAMQARYERALGLIQRSTRLGPNELSSAFEQIRELTLSANAYRVLIGLLGLILVAGLSAWASRALLRGIGHVSRGLSRFSTGDFSEPVLVEQDDEIGRVAADANRMADSLRRLGEERARLDRIKTRHAGLTEELWGDIPLTTAADRALAYLVSVTGARAGALYLGSDDGATLRLATRRTLTGAVHATESVFRVGEGMIGQAALREDITTIDDLPDDYLRIESGLGGSSPRELVLVPLVLSGRCVGLIELAFFSATPDETREFLRLVRRMLVIALEAAKSRERLRALLEESQALAETLATQEAELKRNNEELTSQQEELRLANEELAAQRSELSRRNDELEATRARVQQKVDELAKVSAYKSQFLANMSHELRTPLNSMLLLSHLLSENEAGNLTEKQVEQLKTVHGAGEDLLGLINDVLDLAKIEAGRQDTSLEAIELTRFASFVRRVFEPLATEKGLALVSEIEPGLPDVLVTDALRLERILTNLLGNAIKFTERGQVRLWIHRAPAGVLENAASNQVIAFSVSDTGVGVPSEARERIFAPFEQLESHSNRRYAGTGLGLAIARESAQLLGGDLRLDVTRGEGSTFTCYLPERPLPDRARLGEKQPERPAPDDDRSTLAPNDLYVLVIEDDRVLSEQLVAIIHGRNLKALVATSGTEGLRMARERKPLGILLDVRLPDIDGWAVMGELRTDPVTRSIPVHFVTAIDSPERGLGLGAVGYLTKPVTHADLANAVRALLVAPGGGATKILVVEDDIPQGRALVARLEKEDYVACHVPSAGAAFEAIRSERFGCMILDLGLPDQDGLGLLEALRADPEIVAPRVLVHTGRMLSKQETRELEAYAEAVVLKDARSTDRLLDEVQLFVHHMNAARAPQKAVSERPRQASDVSLRGMKILLAEDDMRTVYALSALLRGKGASVLVADTGREALDVLMTNPDVDGVLMDIMMPEMDGYEAMRRLRKDPRFASLPVIALTARAMKGERERCLEAGASEYLAKPVDGERLLSAVSTWFSQRWGGGPDRSPAHTVKAP